MLFALILIFHLLQPDSIKPNVTYSYSKTATPGKRTDLGGTADTYIRVTRATPSSVTITVDITISLSAAFKGENFSSNLEMQNQGLEREVKAHEEAHKDQIMEAAGKWVHLYVEIDGRKRRFKGPADKVLVKASHMFNQSHQASLMTIEEKRNFIDHQIALPVLEEIGSNINRNIKQSPDLEMDANARAITRLGAQTVKYLNESTPVVFNRLILK